MTRETFLSLTVLVLLGSCESRSASAQGATEAAEFGAMTSAEKDGVTGNLILDGHVDPRAVSRPPYPLAEGFIRLERAAAAGRKQSIADLRAKFTTGLNFEGKNPLIPPIAALAKCWTEVGSGTAKASVCIEMRKKLRVP
jgi:hypothetical protein